MQIFFKDNKKPDICLVFCGWGTDERLYLPVLNDFNYLLFYDYDKNLSCELNLNFNDYNKKYLLSYSAGGMIPAIINHRLPKFDFSVAVNASVKLFGKFGLSQKTVEITKNLNHNNYLSFRREYLVDSDWEMNLFNLNQPLRSFQSCFEELNSLQYIAKKYKNCEYNFDRAFSSQNDKMLPYEEQKEYFKDKLTKIEGGHFPFFRYKSLKQFFE